MIKEAFFGPALLPQTDGDQGLRLPSAKVWSAPFGSGNVHWTFRILAIAHSGHGQDACNLPHWTILHSGYGLALHRPRPASGKRSKPMVDL